MEITAKNLERFRLWVVERGRVEETADLYVKNLKSCAKDPKGLTHRLVGGDLSPNTRRTNLAALSAWARFSKDAELKERLMDLRLPPARRLREKPPLAAGDWRKVVQHLQTCKVRCEPIRCVLIIMAVRGFRSGDVLRMRRSEIVRAISTGKLAFEGKGRKRLEFSAKPIMAQLKVLAAEKDWDRVRELCGKGSAKSVSNRVRRMSVSIAKKCGITDMNPHRFRHTFATNFLAELKGDPNAIVKLQKYMGWESMATAARYVDSVDRDHLEEIAAGLVSGVLSVE